MSNREKAKELIDRMPENKLLYIIAFLEGASIPELVEDEKLYSEEVYRELEKSEQQIEEGKVIDARVAIQNLREKYAI